MKIDVSHIAKLANLKISETETPKFEAQLSEVLQYIKKLEEIQTEGIKPTSQVTGLTSIEREDKATNSFSQAEALKTAKTTEQGMFVVKGVLADA